MEKGILYWITGLSGAGKTTIGNALYYELRETKDNIVILDGDILKKLVGDSLGYTKEDRKKRAYYYSNLCKTLTDQGISVVICTIAMYDEVREWNRNNIEKYIEVFLKVKKETLIKRDRKGLYSAQALGKVNNIVGIDQDVEFPKNPDIIIENDGLISVVEIVRKIVNYSPKIRDSFDRDTEYWNSYYSNDLTELQRPSCFALFVKEYIKSGKKIMDIGCGNGRDSLLFAKMGLKVVGVDASKIAIDRLNSVQHENMPMFVCDDFVTCKALYQAQYDYFYSRWTMHAISERQEDELLCNISSSIKKDGLLFIEARSIHDDLYGVGEKISENEYIYNDHYRRFMDKEIFISKLKKLGYEIVFEVEGNTFSKTRKSDPTLIRIVAKYIG